MRTIPQDLGTSDSEWFDPWVCRGERNHRWTPVLSLSLPTGVGIPEPGAILGFWEPWCCTFRTKELGPGWVKGAAPAMSWSTSCQHLRWEAGVGKCPKCVRPSLVQCSRAPFFAHMFQGHVIGGTSNSARFARGPFGS